MSSELKDIFSLGKDTIYSSMILILRIYENYFTSTSFYFTIKVKILIFQYLINIDISAFVHKLNLKIDSVY